MVASREKPALTCVKFATQSDHLSFFLIDRDRADGVLIFEPNYLESTVRCRHDESGRSDRLAITLSCIDEHRHAGYTEQALCAVHKCGQRLVLPKRT